VYEGPLGRNLSSATNPTLEQNITTIGKPVVKLWPFCISKMAADGILDFIESQIAHSIRQPQKPWPRTKHGVDRMHRLRDIRL